MWRLCNITLVFALLIGFVGCGTVPKDYERIESRAFMQGESTTLGRIFTEYATPSAESGFALLEDGDESLRARAGLLRLAERSIDAQYFIWNPDKVGRLLGGYLLLAAERGARIRVLVDDFNLGQRDRRIAIFNSHPSIEIRLFNPVAGNARVNTLTRMLGFIANFQTLNHRMHNKLFLVDGTAAVVGGRNVGDEYYGLSHEHNLRDRDVLVTGALISELGASFDEYWNNEWAVPFEAVQSYEPTVEELSMLIKEAKALVDDAKLLPFEMSQPRQVVEAQFAATFSMLTWANASLIYDDPDLPSVGIDSNVRSNTVQARLISLLQSAKREVIIESPYLVLTKSGLAVIRELVDRGIKVRILTNSLSSTDVVMAHSGYAKHRLDWLATGADLYEMRYDSFREAYTPGPSEEHDAPIAGLHAKSIIVDREILYVGSYNADQRSALVNTEVAVIIHSPELATRVADRIDRHLLPKNAWQISLGENGEVLWSGQDDAGNLLQYSSPPDTNFQTRFKNGFFSLLPIESLL